MPPGITFDDGADMDECVAYSLWNHPGFEAVLAQLHVSRAELAQAGLLRNPILSILFPLGPKQLEATLALFVDVFWQRDQRIDVAQLDLQRVSETLVSAGLDQARSVRLAYIEALRQERRSSILRQIVDNENQRVALLSRSVELGDMAEIEMEKAKVEREVSRLDFEESNLALLHQLAVLRESLGGDFEPSATDLREPRPGDLVLADSVEELCQRALAARPDYRALELEQESALSSAGLAAAMIPSLELLADANGQGIRGFEAGPGVRVEIPIFDTGGARIDVANSKLLVVVARRRALERRIIQDVRRLHFDFTNRLKFLKRAEADFSSGTKTIAASLERQRLLGDVNALELLAYRRLVLVQELKISEWRFQLQSAHVLLESAVGARLVQKDGIEK